MKSSTLGSRETHDLPTTLPPPPESWAEPYAALAAENKLAWITLADVTAAVRALLDPVLAAQPLRRWDTAAWTWLDDPKQEPL